MGFPDCACVCIEQLNFFRRIKWLLEIFALISP